MPQDPQQSSRPLHERSEEELNELKKKHGSGARQGNSSIPAGEEDNEATGRVSNIREGSDDQQHTADISNVDRQEGEMNNGELGGNLGEKKG